MKNSAGQLRNSVDDHKSGFRSKALCYALRSAPPTMWSNGADATAGALERVAVSSVDDWIDG